MFKRFMPFAGGLAALGILAAISGCNQGASSKKPKIAYVTNGVASFWDIAQAGALAAGKKFEADVTVHMPTGGIGDQKRVMEDLITRGVDGIAISPIDAENETPLIDQAAAATKVITQDSDAPKSKRLCYIGVDNYTAGRMCGKLVKEAMPKGGKVAIFVGRMEQDNARGRRQGVIDELMDRSIDRKRFDAPGNVIRNAKFTIVGTYTDQFDRVKGKANAEDVLSRYPDIAGMIGLFAYNPPLCLEALKQSGKINKVKMIGFDEDEATLKAIKDGSCYGTVVQNPYMYGFESVRILTALANKDESVLPKGGFLDIPARQIRSNNVDEFWADLNVKMGKSAAPK